MGYRFFILAIKWSIVQTWSRQRLYHCTSICRLSHMFNRVSCSGTYLLDYLFTDQVLFLLFYLLFSLLFCKFSGFSLSFCTCGELIPNSISFLNKLLVLLIFFLFVEWRKNKLEIVTRPTSHLCIFMGKSFLQSLFFYPLLFERINFILLTSQNSLGHLLLFLLDIFVPSVLTHVEQFEGVSQHRFLNLIIKRGIGSKRWWLVDLDEPGLEMAVNHYVEA